jgi:hypothetical protein
MRYPACRTVLCGDTFAISISLFSSLTRCSRLIWCGEFQPIQVVQSPSPLLPECVTGRQA